MKFDLLCIASGLAVTLAACPNDCSGHGVCGSAQCECYRNWFGADCSDRVCTFGRAFVDSPTGDLNGDGVHDPHRAFLPTENNHVHGISNVVGGRSELFDEFYGYARSSRVEDWDEAHFYRECSNKGICDRTTGQCGCFPGYWGEGCERTVCPDDCNGHGVCRTLADSYNFNYDAWDLHKTAKCVCDPGFSGPSCSMRECPRGADPVENAQVVTNSVQGIYWNSYFSAVGDLEEAVEWAKDKPTKVFYTLTFTDEFDDEWVTQLLTTDYITSCDSNTACYSMPNVTDSVLMGYAEAVNNSLAAIPNGAVKGHYVWTTGLTIDPSDGTPDSYQSYPSSSLDGASVFVDSLDFRLDAEIVPSFCDNLSPTSDDTIAGMCTFVKMDNQGKQNSLQVKGWYTPRATIDSLDYSFETISIGATDFIDSTITNFTALVVVDDVQGDRVWNVNDGDVEFAFTESNVRELDVCSKRGVCDYSTGLCKCFSGYSGVRCNTQNSISFSY